MKKLPAIFLFSFVALLFLGSCDKEPNGNKCVSHTTAQVTNVVGPDTVSVYQEAEHLDLLKKHVEAKLRERNGVEVSNQSLGSRLPGWMTSSKNRKEVLKGIENLKNKK